MRVLALAVHPLSAPATRFRAEALRGEMVRRGHHFQLATWLDERAFSRMYRSGIGGKAISASRSALRQWRTALGDGPWDVVFVQREAGLVGPPLLEWLLGTIPAVPFVFDFDDAIWMSTSAHSLNPWAARLFKHPSKTWWLMKNARAIVAGSAHLAATARNYNPSVSVVPTVVSRVRWTPRPGRLAGDLVEPGVPVLGWIGSHSTARYLEAIVPALWQLHDEGVRFRLRIIGAGEDMRLGFPAEQVPWSLSREVELFRELDIGLAPLPDDEWARGKCAFKQVQYLSVGVPCVTSPVGAAGRLVDEGLALGASDVREWVRCISELISDKSERARLSQAGRTKVEDWLCEEVQAPRVVDILERAAGWSDG